MYDTIACLLSDVTLDESVFQGQSITEDLETGQVSARMWINPRDEYAPRVTYWSGGSVLKIEASLSKMAGVDPHENMTDVDVRRAIDLIDKFVFLTFGPLPSILDWSCQRIDYAWMWDCGKDASAYMTMLKDLRIGGMTRDVFDNGVVFKQGNRWVKFYLRDNVLRFEVSNYKQAVKYMCKQWFGCERTVREMVHAGRSLYVMALYMDKLGIDKLPVGRASVMSRLRDVYGSSVASAFYAMVLLHEFGASALSMKLISSSSYYTWKKRLSDDGFVVLIDDDVVHVVQSITLSLPVVETIKNLNVYTGGGSSPSPSVNLPKFSGKNLGLVSGSQKVLEKLEMQYGMDYT